MSGGRFGGFRKGKSIILTGWEDRKSSSSSQVIPPTNIFEFDYSTAQGIWDLDATTQFVKRVQYIGYTTSAATSSINLLSNLMQGDLVIVATYFSGSTPSTPTGFTLGQSGFTNSVGYMWSYKFMGATPDTTATGLSAGASICLVFRFTPNATIGLISTASSGTTGMPNCPSITTLKDRTTIVCIGYLDDDIISSSVYFPNKYKLIASHQYGAANTGGTIMAAYYNQTKAGQDDPDVFLGSGDDAWVGITFALPS
jgi:hypothetical protein